MSKARIKCPFSVHPSLRSGVYQVSGCVCGSQVITKQRLLVSAQMELETTGAKSGAYYESRPGEGGAAKMLKGLNENCENTDVAISIAFAL